MTPPTHRPLSARMTLPKNILEAKLLHRQPAQLSRAVFLDRDGTLNLERGYITDPREIELHPDTAQVLQGLSRMGFLVVVISNQSAICRNLMSVQQFEAVNDALWELLRQSGAHYDALYYCPHTPHVDQPCDCRKPKAGLVLQAALELNIDLSSSYFIGDKLADMEAGRRAGCKTIWVLTGKETGNKRQGHDPVTPDCIQNTLTDAFAWICVRENASEM